MQIQWSASSTAAAAAGKSAQKPNEPSAGKKTESPSGSGKGVDTWERSGRPGETEGAQAKGKASGLALDLEAFKLETRRQLLEQVQKSKEELAKAGIQIRWSSDIPYQVDPEEKAADVPEEWGADKTSQRIVDFALSMRQMGDAKNLSDEEFIEKIRGAIEDGFRSAKSDLKELPGPSAKLFNDTYEAAMKKLDQTLEDWKKAKESPAPSDSGSTESTKTPPSTASSGFSVVA